MPSKSRYELIVIGAGAMGAAAACAAGKRTLRTIVIEQFAIGHDRGSSHGDTRICRRAYFEHPGYVPLANLAYRDWEALETATGAVLFERVGLLFGGPADGRVVRGVRESAGAYGVRIDEIPPAVRRERFGMFRVPDEHVALHEPDAGFLRTERAVTSMVETARRAGVDVRTAARVTGWRADSSGVRVEVDGKSISSERLIVTAGPWSAAVLAELNLPLRVERRMQFWFPTDDPRWAAAAGCPVFGFETDDRFFYGTPSLDGRMLKVAEHTSIGNAVEADSLQRDTTEEDVAAVAPFVRLYLPTVDPRPIRHSACMYTMTPDEHFIVDLHPASPRVAIACGFSGHGFKFAPVIGRALVDLVIDGRTEVSIGMFAISRFDSAGHVA